jgi:PAS domain S-box-containing protein
VRQDRAWLQNFITNLIMAIPTSIVVVDERGTIFASNSASHGLLSVLPSNTKSTSTNKQTSTSPTTLATTLNQYLVIDDWATFLSDAQTGWRHVARREDGKSLLMWVCAVDTLLGDASDALSGVPMLFVCNFQMTPTSPMIAVPDGDPVYQQMFEHNQAMKLLIAPSGHVVEANQAVVDFYGYDHDTLVNSPLSQLDAEKSTDIHATLALIINGEIDIFEQRHQLANGELRDVLMQATPVSIGDATYIYAILTDITAYKQMQKELRHREQRYRIMIERMQQGVAVHNEERQFTYVNHAFCKMLGYKPFELLGQTSEMIFFYDDLPMIANKTREREQGNSDTYEIRLRHKDGSVIHAIISASPYRDVEGNYAGAFAVLTDISARIEAEEALVRSNAELDAFAHTVAHDLKNPLSVLMGFADLLESEFKNMAPNEVEYYLQTVGRTADKMINIIDELLLLAQMRHAEVQLMPFDISQTIEECLQRTRYMQLQYGAEIDVIQPDEEMPNVVSYAPWIESALVNYITNAIKYGGTPPRVQIGVTQLDDRRMRIWVRDNGAGISQEKIGRLFVEFDRLEEVRKKGYGIGLSIVKRIMEKLDGEVHVESQQGEGSIFSLIIPAPVGV